MKSQVRYWFNTFEHLTSFDIVPYQDIVDLYMKNHTLLHDRNFEKLGGDNERPLNSDVETIDHKGFWLGYSPAYYNIDPYGKKVTQAKADVISMDMTGIGKTWSHFVYLELPYKFFNQYQTAVHSNDDISFYREFLIELGDDLSKKNVDKLISKYDNIYNNRGSFNNFFREVNDFKWRQDLEIGQYSTIKENGIIYPVMYDSSKYILNSETISLPPLILLYFSLALISIGIFFTYFSISNMKELKFGFKENISVLFYFLVYLSLYPFVILSSVYKFVRGNYTW